MSVEGFIQQLALAYVARGYFFYVAGGVPDHKDPARVDEKLVARYGIDISKWARARRKQAGGASVQYLRHGQVFVILAPHGEHPFFTEEGRTSGTPGGTRSSTPATRSGCEAGTSRCGLISPATAS